MGRAGAGSGGRLRATAVAVALLAPFALGAASQARPTDVEKDAVAFRVQDPVINESSGLVVLDVDGERLFVTVNDSGDSGRVFTLDPSTGETVGTTTFTPAPTDVEALAPAGDGHVWVADIGDNSKTRDHVTITRVPVGRGDRDAGQAESYRLVHPGGPRDAEALVSHPVTGRVYLVSKQVLGGEVWAAPEKLDAGRDNVLERVGPAPMLVTDAAFSPSGEHLVMRGYVNAWVASWPDLDTVAEMRLPRQPQGEGLAVSPEGEVFLSTEGRQRPVLEAPLPPGLADELAAGSFWWRTVWRDFPQR